MNKVNRKELEYFINKVMGYPLVEWQIDCMEKYINILKSNDKKSIIIPRGSGYSSTYAWLYIMSQSFLLHEEENKMEKHKNNRGTIVFDFDGVIHNYRNKWKSPTIIDDTPVEGIKEAIDNLRSLGYKVTIVSVRCAYDGGREAILEWLIKNDIRVDDITALKPPALVYIDDRALCFDGHAETLVDKIQNFIPWNKDNKQY